LVNSKYYEKDFLKFITPVSSFCRFRVGVLDQVTLELNLKASVNAA